MVNYIFFFYLGLFFNAIFKVETFWEKVMLFGILSILLIVTHIFSNPVLCIKKSDGQGFSLHFLSMVPPRPFCYYLRSLRSYHPSVWCPGPTIKQNVTLSDKVYGATDVCKSQRGKCLQNPLYFKHQRPTCSNSISSC